MVYFHSVVTSEVIMTSLFVEFPCRFMAGFFNRENNWYCLWCILAGTASENYAHLKNVSEATWESKIQKFPRGIYTPDLPTCCVLIHTDLHTVAPLLLWNLILPPPPLLNHFLDEGLIEASFYIVLHSENTHPYKDQPNMLYFTYYAMLQCS